MNKDLLKRSIKSIFRNKINFLCIFLLAVSSSIIIFGFSYLNSITNLWNDWTNKAVDFRTFVVTYDYDNLSEDEAIEKLSQFNHILEVTKSSGYIISGNAFEYIDDDNDGEISLRGVTKNSINVVAGSDLSGNKNEIICAINFNPNSKIYQSDFAKDTSIDLSNQIGKTMKIKFAGSNNYEELTIVGLYDSDYDYSAGDTCYATFETVRNLNETYQPDVFDAEKISQDGIETKLPIYFIIDNAKNTDYVLENLESNGFYAERVITINTKTGDSIIKVLMILACIMCLLSFIIILLNNLNRINNRKKEFAIMKSVGYTQKNINELLYTESLLMSIISVFLSVIFSSIALFIMKKYFLTTSVEFSRMNLNISLLSIIISCLIVIVISFLSSHISVKKIEEINIISLLRE